MPEALKFLGREHSADQAMAAIELAQKIFPRLSFDLIYARPGQSWPPGARNCARALALAADHLSLYQLTIEEGTKFHTLYAPRRIRAAGRGAGGGTVRCHGRGGRPVRPGSPTRFPTTPGPAARAGIISAYWRYQDYAGIGPGAHGRLTLGGQLLATSRHRAPEAWADLVEAQRQRRHA